MGCGGSADEAAGGGTRPSTTTPATTTTTASGDGPARPSLGCAGGAPTDEVVDADTTVNVGGDERTYKLTAPASDEPTPVVVDLHGLAEGAEVHTRMSAMGATGLEKGFTTVVPQGTGSPYRWQVGDLTGGPDDAFIDALLAQLQVQRCIDTSRVYATGLSNGAMMTSQLACTRADVFAAFAPVAGITDYDGCDPGRPVPILAFHGTEDPILKFNGGVGDLSAVTGVAPTEEQAQVPEADLDGPGYPATAQVWAERNGCDPEPVDTQLSEHVIERRWDCPTEGETTFVIVVGGGHTWPGSEFSADLASIMGVTTMEIDANEAMWEMFQRHQLPD